MVAEVIDDRQTVLITGMPYLAVDISPNSRAMNLTKLQH